MMIPNIVTKFKNFDIFWIFCEILDLSSAHTRHVVSVKEELEFDDGSREALPLQLDYAPFSYMLHNSFQSVCHGVEFHV